MDAEVVIAVVLEGEGASSRGERGKSPLFAGSRSLG
jgi:hypothetical protein